MKTVWNFLKKYVVIYVVLICSFIVLLYISALLPHTGRFKANMKKSADVMMERAKRFNGNYSRSANVMLDDFTDCIILNHAYNADPDYAVTQYHRVVPGNKVKAVDLRESMINPEQTVKRDYSRYWHGHPAVMKIAHLFLGVNQLYSIIGTFTLVLTVFACLLVSRIFGFLPALILGISMAMSSFHAFSLSLQYYPVYWIGLSGVIFLCLQNKQEWRLPVFFALGMICPFFDFLTAPSVTLVMPMMVVCGYDMLTAETGKADKQKILYLFIKIFCGYAAAWGAGYILSWGTKILLAACVSGNLQSSLNAILFRSGSSNYGNFSRPGVVLKNVKYCLSMNWYLILFSIFAYSVCFIRNISRCKCKKMVFDRNIFAGYLLLAMIPLGFIFVSANHAHIHTWFTYRGVIFSFAAGLMTVTAFRPVVRMQK